MEGRKKEHEVEEIDLEHFVKEARKILSSNKPSIENRCKGCPGNLTRCIYHDKIPS